MIIYFICRNTQYYAVRVFAWGLTDRKFDVFRAWMSSTVIEAHTYNIDKNLK